MIKKLFTLGLALSAFVMNAQTAKLNLNTAHKKAVNSSTLRSNNHNSVSATDSIMYIPCNDPTTATLYFLSIDQDNVIDTGYVFGTNDFPYPYPPSAPTTTLVISNNECAQKYNIAGTASVVGTAFVAGSAYSSAATSTIVSNIYSEDPTSKAPLNLLGTSDVMTLQSVTAQSVNSFTFSTPVTVSNQNFFASVTSPFLGGTTQDTLSILFSDPGCTTLNSDSLSWSYQAVYYMGVLYPAASSWLAVKSGVFGNQYNVDLAIYPIIQLASSGINKVTKGDLSLYAAYPNPANNTINVNFSVEKSTAVEVKVYDITGKIVKTINSNAIVGKNNITLDVTNLEAGSYMYSINAGGTKMFSKFVVTK